jgi:hypothetical protein
MTYSFSNAQNTTSNLQATYRGALVTRAATNAYIAKLWSDGLRRDLAEVGMDLLKFIKVESFGLGYAAGDTINIKTIGRLGENAKVAGIPVTLQTAAMSSFPITLDRHVESSFSIEDIAALLNASGLLESGYTQEAAYALMRGVLGQVLGFRAAANSVAGSVINASANGTTGTGSGASAPLDLNHVLQARTRLVQRKFDPKDFVLFVSPVQFAQLLANQRVQNFFFKGTPEGGAVSDGIVGSLFGIPVYMTTLIDTNSATGWLNGAAATPTPGFASSFYFPTQESLAPVALAGTFDPATNPITANQQIHTAMMLHKDYLAMAKPFEPMSELSREALYLMDVVISSMFYGMRTWRNDGAIIINTNASIPVMTTQF